MATFFGEITEITSRAVWWSDSDDDDDDEKINKRNLSLQSKVVNQDLYDLFLSQCKIIYISSGKRKPNLTNFFDLKLENNTNKSTTHSMFCTCIS